MHELSNEEWISMPRKEFLWSHIWCALLSACFSAICGAVFGALYLAKLWGA